MDQDELPYLDAAAAALPLKRLRKPPERFKPDGPKPSKRKKRLDKQGNKLQSRRKSSRGDIPTLKTLEGKVLAFRAALITWKKNLDELKEQYTKQGGDKTRLELLTSNEYEETEMLDDTPLAPLETKIKTTFDTIKQIKSYIEFLKYKRIQDRKRAKIKTEYDSESKKLRESLDKRFKVLLEILDSIDATLKEQIKLHYLALKSRRIPLKDWYEEVRGRQVAIIDQLPPGIKNMYKIFTTPLYCFVRYDIEDTAIKDRYKTLFRTLFYHIEEQGNRDSAAYDIMMSECELFLEMSTAIFRHLFNDGMIFSSLEGGPRTLKTGCKENTDELIDKGILSSTITCLCCGRILYVRSANGRSWVVISKSACDHTIPMAPSYYYLEPAYYKNNLLYLCKACNLKKSNTGIIDFLYKMFFTTEKMRVPDAGEPSQMDDSTKEMRKTAYKRVFRERLAPHFQSIGSIITSLEDLQGTYNTAMKQKETTLESYIRHVLTAEILVEHEQQTSEQLLKTDQRFAMIIEAIRRQMGAYRLAYPNKAALMTQDTFITLFQTHAKERLGDMYDEDKITREDMKQVFISLGDTIFGISTDYKLLSDGLSKSLMYMVDKNKDGHASIIELREFFSDAIAYINQGASSKRGGSYNKGILGKKTKSKHTKKQKKYKKSKHTKKHKKYNKTKKYKKHKNNKSFKV